MSDVLNAASRFVRSPAFKFFVIGFLILLLMIPLFSVWGLIDEREGRARQVEREIGQLWGGPQSVSGPFLIVPYTVSVVLRRGNNETVDVQERFAVFSPDQLDVTADVSSQMRSRGIYDVPVYTSRFTVSGKFAVPDIRAVESKPRDVRWHDAVLALSLSDVSGLRSAASLEVEGVGSTKFEPSFGLPNDKTIGIHVPLRRLPGLMSKVAATPADGTSSAPDAVAEQIGPPRAFSFSFPIELAGSLELKLAPAARQTTIDIKSDWPHPSFTGAFLPTERNITKDGFTARWQVPDLARSVPPAWSRTGNAMMRLNPYLFGVRFFVPVDFYNLVERAVKYGLMFIAIAFAAVFVIELLSKKSFHAVQYIMVGIAVIFFFVLLLSFAEHIGFLPAYLVASGATGAMLSIYVGRALDSHFYGLAMLAVLSALYALLYVILTLEDYALLVGAIAGFAMLAGVMFLTLRVDWSGRDAAANR